VFVAHVFVAMSGGVDSSVAAALLLEGGHDVTGVTMRLHSSAADEIPCCAQDAVRDAQGVCDLLGIAHVTVDVRDLFEREVVGYFAEEYAAGRTPNPCIHCNETVKFSRLMSEVTARGAEYLATGHYARLVTDDEGVQWLARAKDPSKDQSYFLYRLTRPQMQRVLFPVGEYTKLQVREIAMRLSLPIAEKPDSQEVCFAPAGEHAGVVRARHPEAFAPGNIVDVNGAVLGTHTGIANYTVGQRKGLGIGGAEPLYVLEIDAATNRIVVGPRTGLAATHVIARDPIWYGAEEETILAMVRYRMQPAPARAHGGETRLDVEFDEPVEGIAPGQAVVCYRDDLVVGGGVIECAS
jgi:tRNA-uridine 2-sulfurtransferase